LIVTAGKDDPLFATIGKPPPLALMSLKYPIGTAPPALASVSVATYPDHGHGVATVAIGVSPDE
jgi:hypothetical protein